MHKHKMSYLGTLTSIADARNCRASSWDQPGRNKDYWLIDPGKTMTLAEIEGPGCASLTGMLSTGSKHG